MAEVDVIIDSREKRADYYVSELIKNGIKPKVEMLNTGDILILGKDREKDSTLCEVKTAKDFLGSLEGKKDKNGIWEKGRIWDQLKRMKESGVEDRRLIIEGNFTSKRLTVYRRKAFTKERIWGSLHGIKNWDTEIVQLRNPEETVRYITYLANKKKRPKRQFTLRASPNKSMSLKEQKLYLLQGLPGVGASTSKEILKKYKTIKNFINKVDTVDTISGIGKKTKDQIKKVLE